MKNEFYSNIGQLVQAGTANVSVNAAAESVWQMFGHCSDDEILQIKQQLQNEIIALQRKGLQFVLSTVAVTLMYAGLFYFDVYRWVLGKDSLWGMGVAVLCLVAWLSTMGNAIKHDIEPKIDKLKKDRECLDDILRYRQYLLITKNSPFNQDL